METIHQLPPCCPGLVSPAVITHGKQLASNPCNSPRALDTEQLGPGSLGARGLHGSQGPLGPGAPVASWCALAEAAMPAAALTYYAGLTFMQHLVSILNELPFVFVCSWWEHD